MRPHPHRSQLVDEVLRVIGLVGAERDGAGPIGERLDHVQRRHPLGMPIGPRQACIDQQPRAVLHQAVTDEAELRLLARPLAVEPGVRIGGARMRLVRPLLPVEVRFGVAPRHPPADCPTRPSA